MVNPTKKCAKCSATLLPEKPMAEPELCHFCEYPRLRKLFDEAILAEEIFGIEELEEYQRVEAGK
jgi:hypothetical protein